MADSEGGFAHGSHDLDAHSTGAGEQFGNRCLPHPRLVGVHEKKATQFPQGKVKSQSHALSYTGSFLRELPFCFKKGDGREEVGAMWAPGREVGNSFADHAVG